MKTLKDFTTALAAAGCFGVKMERSYNRVAGYREVLVHCFFNWPPTQERLSAKMRTEKARSILSDIVDKLKSAGFELTHESWEWSTRGNVEIWVQAKVAPSDQY